MVGKVGRLADVLAVKDRDLAVIEVKSPKETSVVKKYDDSANLSSVLRGEIGDYLGNTRLRILGLFPQRGQSIAKLYAVSIACQLYRYVHEIDELVAKYEQASHKVVKLANRRFNKRPFIVIPLEYEPQAMSAVQILTSNGYISSVTIVADDRVTVIGFSFLV